MDWEEKVRILQQREMEIIEEEKTRRVEAARKEREEGMVKRKLMGGKKKKKKRDRQQQQQQGQAVTMSVFSESDDNSGDSETGKGERECFEPRGIFELRG